MTQAPKILFLDIETAPNLSYVWGQYEQNVIAHEREWYLLCVGYRWYGKKKTQCVALPDFEKEYKRDPEDDSRLAQVMWELVDSADIIIGHNGDRFDLRKLNARFLAHDFPPPRSYKTIDTLKVARKYFMLNSNKLGDIGQYLNLGGKEDTGGFKTWAGCMRGEPAAWRTMIKYCKKDVDLLIDVYERLKPWMTNHPNLNVYTKQDGCPTCGHHDLTRRGNRYTQTYAYTQFQCKRCGAYSKLRTRDKAADAPTIVP